MPEKSKLIIFGMDGATFDVAGPLMESGEMPVLKSIIENGCGGLLESTTPWHSASAWTTCATGLNPGSHGVFNFFIMNRDFTEKPVTSADIHGDRLWRILNRNGFKTGVFNVPLTYPVEPVDGFMVSGLPRSCAEASPPGIAPLLESCRHCVGIHSEEADGFITNKLQVFQQRINQEISRIKLAAKLSVPAPDFFMGVFTVTDEIQHSFWYAHDPDHPGHGHCDVNWEPAVLAMAYKLADKNLEKIMDMYAGPETTVMVVSDHGFGPARHAFFPNRLLREWGLLAVRTDERGEVVCEDSMLTPARLGIDLGRTTAFMGPSLSNSFVEIYINRAGRTEHGIVPDDGYEKTVDEIAGRFESWTDPETGLNPVRKSWKRAELFHGPMAGAAPDLLLECGEFNCFSQTAGGGVIEDVIPWRLATNGQSGIHTQFGIFAASGPGIKKGEKIEGLHISGVAPTALHIFGLPVPEAMDGRVMEHIFEDDYISRRPVRYAAGGSENTGTGPGGTDRPAELGDDETKAIADTLKGLGYFD